MKPEHTRAIMEVDRAAVRFEKLWHPLDLRGLVSDRLGAMFDEQSRRFNEAITNGQPAAIIAQARGMVIGWEALSQEALARGHLAQQSILFEMETPGGVKVGVVESSTTRVGGLQSFDGVVMTREEIGRILDEAGIKFIDQVKAVWPGASVVDVRALARKEAEQEALKRNNLNDEIPF